MPALPPQRVRGSLVASCVSLMEELLAAAGEGTMMAFIGVRDEAAAGSALKDTWR